jgi:hypothetical protein
MSYTIYHADGTSVTVPDNAIDNLFYNATPAGSSLGIGTQLIGRNTINYGAAVAQNFLQMTENFASEYASRPIDTKALQGQLWFDKTSTTSGTLCVRTSSATSGGDSNWKKVVTADYTTGDVTLTGAITATQFNGPVTLSVNIAGGLIGYIPYQSAANTTALLSPGPSGYVLTSNGAAAPSWQAVASASTTPAINPTTGTEKAGDIKIIGSVIYIYAAGAWQQVFPAVYS